MWECTADGQGDGTWCGGGKGGRKTHLGWVFDAVSTIIALRRMVLINTRNEMDKIGSEMEAAEASRRQRAKL